MSIGLDFLWRDLLRSLQEAEAEVRGCGTVDFSSMVLGSLNALFRLVYPFLDS